MRHTKSLLSELNRKEKCAVVIGDDEGRKEAGMLRKNELLYRVYCHRINHLAYIRCRVP